ncbi:hypothetical protein N8987_03445 [Crocinitomix sp.]|nr:hypothetical protein [Crocinitomix sp.]
MFNTRNLEEAVRLKFDFENELVQTDYQLTKNHQMKDVVKPEFMVECMAMYVGYMNNVDVPAHKVKVRTGKHIGDVERYFKYFLLALKAKGIDHTIFRVNQLNDEVVAIFHSYLLIDLNYRNKTYNKAISQFRHFINWLVNDHGYELKNPFIGVTRRYTTTNKKITHTSAHIVFLWKYFRATIEFFRINFDCKRPKRIREKNVRFRE